MGDVMIRLKQKVKTTQGLVVAFDEKDTVTLNTVA